jgi:hypothetical protein
MTSYQLNQIKTFAQKFVDGVATGEWLNVELNQQFKQDVLEGVELQDADGNVMTQEEADNFINELP